ncbi:MAG: tetratricopeptide repeat protein [Muribaculaceae bacterium]|nr:tetratricopeptide repeat protein [Muribaculaceae bacterium]
MKLRTILSMLLLAGASIYGAAQGSINNPVTRAAIRAYTEEIQENPQNYNALLGRGNEYYQHDDYVRAIEDFTEGLKYAPSKGEDAGTRMQMLLLRADIYNQTKRHEDALKDLTEAYLMAPDSYAIVYQKANTEYMLGKYAAADADYKRLRTLNPRSVESYIGQARVAVKQNNLGIANELLAQAVGIDPNNGDTFVRRASVRKLMGDHNGAVDDLILALSTNDERPNDALKELLEYGNTNYAAVIAGLTNAMQSAPTNAMFPYLRAMIAQSHYKFLAALTDYKYIIDKGLYNYHGIYASMAECQYALGRYQEALESIDTALGMTRGQAGYFAVRSDILRALGRGEGAVTAAEAGLIVDPSNSVCLTAMGKARVATGAYAEASASFGEAVMNDMENPQPLLLRAWVSQTYLKLDDTAKSLLNQATDINVYGPEDVRSLKGFALLELGEKAHALAWMERILRNGTDSDGLAHYYATCLFARANEADRALECMEKALELGFANYHLWADATEGWLNPGDLRNELRFLNLLNRYNIIFGK